MGDRLSLVRLTPSAPEEVDCWTSNFPILRNQLGMSATDDDDPWTFFGTWPTKNKVTIVAELNWLSVRFEFIEDRQDENSLRVWYSWDPSAIDPYVCHNLWIHDEDLPLVGNFFPDTFRERDYLRE